MRIVIAAEHAGIGAAETTAFTVAAELGRVVMRWSSSCTPGSSSEPRHGLEVPRSAW